MVPEKKSKKSIAAGIMVGAALGMYSLAAPPAVLGDNWCPPDQDTSCSNYCYGQGYGWYCCLTTQTGGYSCTCYIGPGSCS